MARTYSSLVSLVRNWANRDTEVLTDAIIDDCLKYAADKSYRYLRITPLENTVVYNSAALIAATTVDSGISNNGGRTELSVPSDLIEFIQIREVDANNNTTRVFNQKLDLRTYNDVNAIVSSDHFTRQGSTILLSPGFQQGRAGNPTAIELHYYRRLAALDAKYSVTAANYAAGFLTESVEGADGAEALYLVTSSGVTTAYDTLAEATAAGTPVTTYFVGNEATNWLRDENERLVLMGALSEAFAFLQEDEQAQKYATMFMNEIQELNDEDKKRNARGGNIQTNFTGGGLI